MFTELRLLNFKAWGEDTWREPMKLGRVTLLLGPNSSGKTSLIQSLLLLKQTFSSPDRQLDLNLGGQEGDLLDLGTFRDVVSRNDQSKDLGIGFRTKDGIAYEARFTLAAGAPVTELLKIEKGNHVYSERRGKGGYLLAAPGYQPRQIGKRAHAKRAFAPERSLAFSATAIAELGSAGAEVQDLSLSLTRRMNQIAYLGPLREAPARSYLWSRQSPGDLGARGQFAAMALLASANSMKKGTQGGRQVAVLRGRRQDSGPECEHRRCRLWYFTGAPPVGSGTLRSARRHDHRRAAGDPLAPPSADGTRQPYGRGFAPAQCAVHRGNALGAPLPPHAVPRGGSKDLSSGLQDVLHRHEKTKSACPAAANG